MVPVLFFRSPLSAQNKAEPKKPATIRIKQARSLSYDEMLHDAKILRGDVICEHDGALLYCDTAYIFEKENRMQASGHILITQGDSIRVTAEKLIYDGKNKMASLVNRVKCVERDMVLTTPAMQFDLGHSIASYYNGGVIVNQTNTLSSKHGHYFSAGKTAAFQFDVKLENPEYTMSCDTLRYKVDQKTAYFLGPSIIRSKNDYIYCENGWYDTRREFSRFSRNAVLVTTRQTLRGDSLEYDRLNKTGKAFRHVSLTDTSEHSVLYGDFIEYREKENEARVIGKAVYARLMEKDTFFLGAKQLYYNGLDSLNTIVLAYPDVKIFHRQIQGQADSASYQSKDSLLVLHRNPILWTNQSQGTAKFMTATISKRSIKGFSMEGQALLIQDGDSLRHNKFNQLSGKTIRGSFQNDSLRKVTITGNVDILYYPKSEKKYMGLNNTNCNEAILWFKANDIERVSLKPKSSGQLKPMNDPASRDARLKGFNWQYDKRPKSRQDLHRPE